jgi:hypothetical protein
MAKGDSVQEHIQRIASSGGRARAAKYSSKKFREWGRQGGRPRTRPRFRVTLTFVPGDASNEFRDERCAKSFVSMVRKRFPKLVTDVNVKRF